MTITRQDVLGRWVHVYYKGEKVPCVLEADMATGRAMVAVTHNGVWAEPYPKNDKPFDEIRLSPDAPDGIRRMYQEQVGQTRYASPS